MIEIETKSHRENIQIWYSEPIEKYRFSGPPGGASATEDELVEFAERLNEMLEMNG